MMVENTFKGGMRAQRMVQVHGAAAGDHEDVAHAKFRQPPGNVLRQF
jgi:hypothetical protein